MARKSKIALHRSDDLEAVDAELDVAMSDLDATNERVADLLSSYAPEEPEPAGPDGAAPQPEGAAADSQHAGDPDAKGASPSGHEGAKQPE